MIAFAVYMKKKSLAARQISSRLSDCRTLESTNGNRAVSVRDWLRNGTVGDVIVCGTGACA